MPPVDNEVRESMALKIITNNVPRDLIDAGEATAAERQELDYLPWDKIDAGESSASLFRYRGRVFDLSEFRALLANDLAGWDGAAADSYFSGTLVRFVPNDPDVVIVGRYCS